MIPRLPTICIAAAAFHAATCAASAHSLTVETSAYLSYSLISGGGGMSNLHSSSDTSATSAAAAISATVQSTYLESRAGHRIARSAWNLTSTGTTHSAAMSAGSRHGTKVRRHMRFPP